MTDGQAARRAATLDLMTDDESMVRHLTDLEEPYDAARPRTYAVTEMMRFALQSSDYWAALAIGWMEQGAPATELLVELEALEMNRAYAQSTRHRARRMRRSLAD